MIFDMSLTNDNCKDNADSDMCKLCSLFPNPVYQIVSCGGVDFNLQTPWPGITGATKEFISDERM